MCVTTRMFEDITGHKYSIYGLGDKVRHVLLAYVEPETSDSIRAEDDRYDVCTG